MIDHYTKRAPDAQNTIDLFSGEWSSSFPEPFKQLDAGYAPLFEDPRIEWATSTLGGCEGQRVLELGPLESGHTWLLRRLGASSVTAIESNSRAYLRCLVVKELMQLQGTQTLYGDFLEYLRPCTEHFDLCLASGVLYHMVNPAELIGLIAKVSDRAIIWTHYYDQALWNGTNQSLPPHGADDRLYEGSSPRCIKTTGTRLRIPPSAAAATSSAIG